MRRVNIVLNDYEAVLKGDVIGVDYGAWVCVLKKQEVKLACGDFDSVSAEQLAVIESKITDVHKLNPKKDLTDFSYALSLCNEYDEIFVFGALGGRRDHEYIHVMAAMQDSRIKLFNDQNLMYQLGTGLHAIEKKDYTYISFFVIKPGILSLIGFKYSLEQYQTNYYDSHMSSNEIINKTAEVLIEEGLVLVIQAKSSNH